jgi:hypothetical protein
MAGGVLLASGFQPSFNPLPEQAWFTHLLNLNDGKLYGSLWTPYPYPRLPLSVQFAAQFFWVNWVLALVNVFVCGFPLDGARMLRALFWPHLGYRQATLWALLVSFVVMLITGAVALVTNEMLVLFLAMAIYACSKVEWLTLETGAAGAGFGRNLTQGHPVQIVLPEALKQFVDNEVKAGGFAAPADYVLKLVQEAHQRQTATGIRDPLVREGLQRADGKPAEDAVQQRPA